MDITHYSAGIKIRGIRYADPERAPLTDQVILEFANHGTTPVRPAKIAELQPRVAAIREALLAGKTVETSTAIITPLTGADFEDGKLTPSTGYLRL